MSAIVNDHGYRLFKRQPTGQWVIYHKDEEVFSTYSQAEAERKYTRLISGTLLINSSLNIIS